MKKSGTGADNTVVRVSSAPGPADAARIVAPLLAVGSVLSIVNMLLPGYLRPGAVPLAVFLSTAVGSALSAFLVARFGIPGRFVLPAALAGDANAVLVLWSLQHPAGAGPIVLSLSLPTMLVSLFGSAREVAAQAVAAAASGGAILALAGDGWPEIVPHLLLTAYASAGSAYVVLRLRLRLESTVTQARQQSVTDELTTLHNRRGFEDRARWIIADAVRLDRPVTVLLGDVDHFKRVNDTYGHAVGDQVLRTVAEAVSACVRETDVVARLGGEEFVVLSTVTPERVPVLAERIRQAVADACAPWGVTISIGGSWSRLPADLDPALETVWTLVDEADGRMFEAKRDGRNRVRVPAPSG